MAGNPTLPTENIDEVILRLLALEPNEVDELDYETYSKYLRELLTEISAGRKIDSGEVELIRKEFKRVRGKKGRFRIVSKKSKVTATGLGLGGIRKQTKVAQQRIMLMPVGGIPKGGTEVKEKVEKVSRKKKVETDPLIRISKTLDSILRTLTNINKENRKRIDKERRDSETRRRGGREKDLESKRFDGIKKALSIITKPFQSIWDRIVQFITNVVLGRIVLKLLDWFADPNNQGKINSIIRFFGDHWPTLLALYLRFGTGIGRFVGKLTGFLIKGAIKLGALTARLLASAGLKRFGAAASFLGGPRGKLLGAGLSLAATVGGTLALGKGIESLGGGDKQEAAVPQFSGGGWNKGFASAKNFFGNMFSGLVKGPKGRDKVPAMLTDGEFVMSAGAVRKFGIDTFESMNAAGGGTNIPQIASGIIHAAGGGYIGDPVAAQEAWSNYMKSNPAKFGRGGEYASFESVNKASRDFMKTYMKTGKPPEWANIKQKTTRVQTPRPQSSSKPPSTSITRPTPQGQPRGGALSTNLRATRPNMNVSRGLSGLKSMGAGLLLDYLVQSGLDYAEAKRLASTIEKARKESPEKLADRVEKLREIVDKEERFQKSLGGVLQKVIALGGETGSEVLSRQAKTILAGLGAKTFQGGAVKGGYGLKKQQFKDMPKTQIMTDSKGRPFVGHKALRGGKPVYVRGPQPGTGTTNPLEALGRMINPGAYKENDQRLAMKNQKIAMVNALEGFQKQGMAPDAQARMMKQMGGNLKDVQNDLNYRKKTTQKEKEEQKKLMSGNDKMSVMRRNNAARLASQQTKKPAPKPLPKPRSKPIGTGSGGLTKPRGGSGPSSGSKPPRFSPTHKKGTRTAQATLGIKK